MELLPKTYDFSQIEEKIYSWWESNGYFKPWNDPNKSGFDSSVKPFVIVIPPPNVTGELHLGHPLFVSMEDLMIRYHRMKGIPTLWVPGTDHAGIATQLQVEKLLASQGLKKEELGRDEFEKRVWEWKEKYGGIITKQIRRLGASCDWDRERFTLDDGLSVAVREAFVRLYEKGLIYRGVRMINWSPGLMTAVSDLEVEYSEEKGKLFYFKYMLADGSGKFIPVATTRPETILGDVAVAVHPEDERYKKIVGKMVTVPILGREIPIIADEYVEREFGTGALKITPAHDPHDYEIGIRHNLEMINILNKDATINENGGIYLGLDRFSCRKKIWEDMKNAGLVIKEEPYIINVPRSQRGGEIIEPILSTQWFVKIQPLAEKALNVVKEGKIKIVPERFTKVYYNWMENIQDWCISRQLWWGHRLPVWYCRDCEEVIVAREDVSFCPNCNSSNIYQDPDVLDTWFSSGLWPFSSLGWPEKTPDFEYFYPTSVLETGYDILFFWVARMIMDGVEFTGQVPFHTVYLHGMIRDEKGQKMSKTKGNAIDPLNLINEMGCDALRFTLLVGSTPGADMNISEKRVESNRNFANKIWNIGRFVISTLEKIQPGELNKVSWSIADKWVWAKKKELVNSVNDLFENHQYGEAGRQIYEFLWGDFADWYLEISKAQIENNPESSYLTGYILVRVLDSVLRLLHPFTPFVTEALWGYLKNTCEENFVEFSPAGGWEDALILGKWPEKEEFLSSDAKVIVQFDLIQELIRSIRNIRSSYKIEPSKKIDLNIVTQDKAFLYEEQRYFICALSGIESERFAITDKKSIDGEDCISFVVNGDEIYIPLSGIVNKEAELERLSKELIDVEKQIERLEDLINSPFGEKAPKNVVQKEKEKLEAYYITREKLQKQL